MMTSASRPCASNQAPLIAGDSCTAGAAPEVDAAPHASEMGGRVIREATDGDVVRIGLGEGVVRRSLEQVPPQVDQPLDRHRSHRAGRFTRSQTVARHVLDTSGYFLQQGDVAAEPQGRPEGRQLRHASVMPSRRGD